MDYLPLFAKVSNKPILLVGGGEVALRKARLLLEAGARLTVVAPQLHEELQELADAGVLHYLNDEFSVEQLAEQRLVIAATDDEAVNAGGGGAAVGACARVQTKKRPAS